MLSEGKYKLMGVDKSIYQLAKVVANLVAKLGANLRFAFRHKSSPSIISFVKVFRLANFVASQIFFD